jgi:hypothetical protein
MMPALLAGTIAVALVLAPAAPRAAHHSWDTYNTRIAYYVTGALTDVTRGGPHVEVNLHRYRCPPTSLPTSTTSLAASACKGDRCNELHMSLVGG